MIEMQELERVMEEIGQKVRQDYREELKAKDKVVTGRLYNSIDYRLEVSSTGWKLYFKAEDYWEVIEKGRKPGTLPPVQKIFDWMVKRGIPAGGGREWAVARSIQENGIRPTPILQGIMTEIRTSYTSKLEEAIRKDLKEIIKQNLNTKKQNGN